MLTWSETCWTFSIPCILPVFDLAPRSYHDSMPGSRALKPLRWSRLRCGSESNDRLLSAMKSMQPGGTASSIASMVALKRTPKFGIVPGDPRPLQRPHEEAQILLHHLAVQGLIGHVRIDTKAAG